MQYRHHQNTPALIVILLALVAAFSFRAVGAQGAGELVTGQPAFGNIGAAGQKLTYSYSLTDARAVSFQVIGEVAQPTITILQNGQVIAAQPNAEATNIVSLTALLNAGTYAVEISTVNNTTGNVIVVVQSETIITSGQLPLASVVTGQVTADAPLATYNFNALPEAAFLYVESTVETNGANILLRNLATNTDSTINGADAIGARFRIPAGAAAYEIQLSYSGAGDGQPFSLCLTLVSASSCESALVVTVNEDGSQPVVTPEVPVASTCTVTPLNANGANIRQTANTASPIIIGLPGGQVANVIGIAPDGSFFHVTYLNATGWVAQVAVSSAGECSNLPVDNPPIFVPTPTPTPIPTAIPPTHTPSGPCLITMTDEQLVYTTPNAIPDYIFDEVQPGYQLIPVGRLGDNSWWKTNYNSAWIQTSVFGSKATVTGNCNNLPVVAP
ncbi:MAG: SH3 domain-containing protein [Anaerolineae bacterium]|nr:SH3 domain-containing protein [Anaerolineae bacterium]